MPPVSCGVKQFKYIPVGGTSVALFGRFGGITADQMNLRWIRDVLWNRLSHVRKSQRENWQSDPTRDQPQITGVDADLKEGGIQRLNQRSTLTHSFIHQNEIKDITVKVLNVK